MSLASYLGPAKGCEVIIIDQFEEVLTVDPADWEEKHEFFVQLGEALEDPRRWAVLAMREDYLAGLDPYVKLVPTRLSNTFRLDLLKQDAALDAMRGPAAEQQVEFDAEAAAALATNLSLIRVDYGDGRAEETRPGGYVEPVHLQVVCQQMWEKLPEGTKRITAADLAGAGDVDAALRKFYDDTLTAVAAPQERELRTWFGEQLITPQKTRGQALQGDSQTLLLQAYLAALVDAHLIRSERRRGSLWYELAHDRLIQPVLASNADWFEANLHKLQKTAAVWEAQGRPAGLLLTGPELKAAREWVTGRAVLDIESQFLRESIQQEELAQERRDRQIAERRRWKRIALAAGLAAVVMAGLTLWALLQQSMAESLALAARAEAAYPSDPGKAFDLAKGRGLAREPRRRDRRSFVR